MTSEERREARYRRRKAERANKKAENCTKHDDFEQVFSYEHLYQSYRICRKGVAWKASVQKYITQAPLNIMQTYRSLHNGTFKTGGFFEFDLMERGKKRHIRSVKVGERVVQRCLCDNALVPVLERTFIYDNGACMKNKGYTFTVRRLCQHLREHYRKYGNQGYILLFDFRKFYDNISHRLLRGILNKEFADERIIQLTNHFINAFGEIGLGLGSQVSQILALASANKLDHFIKEKFHIRGYARYNDDGYLIHPDKSYLRKCLDSIKWLCDELEIKLNEKKTQIVKLSHGFTFLKIRFFLTNTGKVIRKIRRRTITKMRQKLKSLKVLQEQGVIEYADIYACWQSWKSYAENFNAYHTIKNMAKLFDELFIKSWLSEQQNYIFG